MAGKTAVCLAAGVAVHRILGAIRDRIDVAGGPADRIAGRRRKRSADNQDGSNSVEHHISPSNG
jgi:hypothetical protein